MSSFQPNNKKTLPSSIEYREWCIDYILKTELHFYLLVSDIHIGAQLTARKRSFLSSYLTPLISPHTFKGCAFSGIIIHQPLYTDTDIDTHAQSHTHRHTYTETQTVFMSQMTYINILSNPHTCASSIHIHCKHLVSLLECLGMTYI